MLYITCKRTLYLDFTICMRIFEIKTVDYFCLAYKTLNQYINAFITRVYHRCSICMGNQMVTSEISN